MSSEDINLAARGRVMRELSGEFRRAHERMSSLPRIVHRAGPTDAQIQARRLETVEKIQRTFKNSNLQLKANPEFTGRRKGKG